MAQGVSSHLNRSSSGFETSGPQCQSLVPRSREGLKTTNFRRLPRRWKAQSARFFFMKSKFKIRLLHKNSVCSSTTPGN